MSNNDPTLSAVNALLGVLNMFADPAKAKKLIAEFEERHNAAAQRAADQAAEHAAQAAQDRQAAEQARADANAALAEARAVSAANKTAMEALAAREADLNARSVAVEQRVSDARYHETKAASDRQTAEGLLAEVKSQREKTAKLLGVDLNAA